MPVQILRKTDAAAAVLDAARIDILRSLAEPGSASSIGKQLGLPRQRVNYHLRELEKAGLVKLVEERRKGNCTERVVQATARSYLISPEVLGALGVDPERVEDRLSSAYLVAVAALAIRELAELRRRADHAGKPLASLTVQTEVRFASAADRNAFAEDIANSIAQLAREYHTPEGDTGGRLFKFFLGGYPAITKPDETGGDR